MADEKLMADGILVEQNIVTSSFLERDVIVDAYLPKSVQHPEQMSLLLINDGQDLPKMPFDEILDKLIIEDTIDPLMCIGIHCGLERKMEYGTANEPDYQGRGARAMAYTQFVFEELLPFIHDTYRVASFKEKSFAGFSLGALSALDIVWNHPQEFNKVGLFSGSFWWRNKSYKHGYNDAVNRIMHKQIREGEYHEWLQFFFECGALDETKDRNHNGIIDSIDDTLDLIKELHLKGYPEKSIRYLELPEGRHDVFTWGKAFPDFLKWGWGKK
ncbi:esterase family protein [Panacibacter ginsenosidivorans]|uniref:Esterase family protein n=1 Tax=Panacibacter ginsenosidivorans TaxID=1813871 RepID=A0A5B8V9M7_9BACT|nr:alpha/beta hydrolase-fold protein [Panacibacter ginsenosidivorans]QEC67623.1 esterase family protein [Panacibacter ginsenosidivorans]